MNAQDFLNSPTFSLSNDIKLEPLDPSKINTVSEVNLETIEFVQSETLEGLLQASATSDNSIDPDQSSYQPLNEAGLATAGNSTAQSAMGSNVNNSLGVQSQSLNSLRTAAQVVPPIEGVDEQPQIVSETEELIIGAQTTISNALIGIANNADKAEGAQKISSPTQLELGGNSIYLISETMVHTSTPVVSTVAEVVSTQAKVIQVTADLVSENVKNRFSNIEGTNTEVATNKVSTTIGRKIEVASEINTTALTNHTINADVMETYAQSLIELRSTKSTRITADENIVNQAGNISITASPGSKKTPGKLESPGDVGDITENADGSKDLTTTNAAGEQVRFKSVKETGEPKWKQAGAQLEGVASNPNPAKKTSAKGNITMVAFGEKGEGGSLTIVNNTQTTSSKESQTNLAKDINSLAENSVKTTGKKISSEAETLASLSSGRNIQFSTSSSMTLMTGGQTFQGLRKSDIGKMAKIADIGGPIELKEIPKLPKLPSGITAEGLQECIKKGKNGGLNQKVEDIIDDAVEVINDVEEGAEAVIDAARTLLGLGEDEEPNFDDIKLSKKPKKKQKVESPSVKEAGRREKEHPLPTGKDDAPIGTSLEDSGSELQSNKLPKLGPLSESTSPTAQSNTKQENELIGAAGVIEGGPDIFTEDEEDNEDILDENKPEDVKSSGDELTVEDNPLNELSSTVLSAIDFYTLKEYMNLAIKFTTEQPGYHIVSDETFPIKGLLLFPEDYYSVVIKYLKRKYSPQPYTEDLEWKTVTKNNEVVNEEDYFNDYYIRGGGAIRNSVLTIEENEFFFKGVGKDWVDYLEEQVLSMASIGGILGFAKNAVKFVKNNVNISDNIDDLKSGNAQRVLGGLGKSLSPSLGGEYFTDASNIIKQSTFLQEVYKNTSTTFDPYVKDVNGNYKRDENGELIRNPTNNVEGFINAIDIAGLQKVLDTATNIIGEDKIQISQNLITGLQEIKELDIYQREGPSTKIDTIIIKVIQDSTGVTREEAARFFYDTKDRIYLIINNDIEAAATGIAIDGVLSVLLGPANTQAIKDLGRLYSGTKKLVLDAVKTGKEAYETGKQIYNEAGNIISAGEDLYTSIKAAPAILATMNYYEVPTLNQVNTLLTCLDIKNNVKDIIGGVKNIGKSINKLEELGGDLFNILDGIVDNVEEGAGIIKERVESLVRQADTDGPQLTPRIINEAKNTNLLASSDLMSTLTNGLVSGSIASNTSRGNNNSSNSLSNQVIPPTGDTVLEEGFVRINSPETNESVVQECPPVYDAFVETNESQDPRDWETEVTDEELFKTIETLPRLTQMYNSILELPTGQTIEGLTQQQIIDIKNTKVNIKLDPCFTQVKLNVVESKIKVLELKKGVILFEMEQIKLLKLNNKNVLPGPNTLIQIYVEEFFEPSRNRVLNVERSISRYTPVTYNFKIVKYKAEENLGIAQLIPTQSRIYLRNADDNLVYNYNILDIGNKLEPQILDSYVVL